MDIEYTIKSALSAIFCPSFLPMRQVLYQVDCVYDKGNKNKPSIKTATDQKGKFELSNISGCLWKCPPIKVSFEHSNYQTKEVEIQEGEEMTIEIEIEKKSK